MLVTSGSNGVSGLHQLWYKFTNTPYSSEVAAVAIGDVVVCEHPLLLNMLVIKRVGAVYLSEGRKMMRLYGDNHLCGESNQGRGLFGNVRESACLGTVVAVIPRS